MTKKKGIHLDTKTRPVEHTQTRDETCPFSFTKDFTMRNAFGTWSSGSRTAHGRRPSAPEGDHLTTQSEHLPRSREARSLFRGVSARILGGSREGKRSWDVPPFVPANFAHEVARIATGDRPGCSRGHCPFEGSHGQQEETGSSQGSFVAVCPRGPT